MSIATTPAPAADASPVVKRPPLPAAVGGEVVQLHRFSTSDYLRMVDAGVLGPDDKVELIDGIIVAMSPANPPHDYAIQRLLELFAPCLDRFIIRIQSTMAVGDGRVFEPDFALIIRRGDRRWKREQVRAADLVLAVESSDASLGRDLGAKLRGYAAAGVPEYWVVDVESERVLVHRQPLGERYGEVRTLAKDDTVAPLALPDFFVRVGDLFE